METTTSMKMKKAIFIIFSLLLSTVSIYAQTWEFIGLDSLVVKQIYVSGDTIWAGTSHRVGNQDKSGLYKSIDAGKYWFRLDSSLGMGHVSFLDVDELNTNIIYIIKGITAYGNAGIFYRTTDGGESWDVAQNITQNVIKWFGISPFNKSEIYFISDGFINILYRSTDAGENWKVIGSFPADSHGNRVAIALDLLHDSTLYASVSTDLLGEYFYKSTNKGDSWLYVSSPPSWPVIFTDYFIPYRIYLFPEPYVSNDGGLIWFLADSGLTGTPYYLSFYQDEETTKLYYLRRDGLYSSKNDSIYWQLIENSETLPLNVGSGGFNSGDVGMINIFINTDNDIIYIGTAQGVYKSSVLTSVKDKIENIINNLSLRQNYPNPFNSSTVIEYQIISRANVSLKIYDILGNELATLVDEEQPAGNYKVTFDIGIIRSYNFTSGVYIYEIQAGGYVSSRKMIYLK